MRFPWTSNADSNKLLLKRCNDGDPAALQKFTGHSYLNEILKAVRGELQNDYDPPEIEKIAKVCVVHIYSLWSDLPSPISDLRTRIRKAAKVFAFDWRRQDLP